MTSPTGRHLARAAVLLACLPLLGGCSSSGPLLSRRTTVGTLKASMAQLEKERDDSRQRLAQLEKENRKIRDDLALERQASGELTARLDDARALLTDQGLASRLPPTRSARVAPAATDEGFDELDAEPARPRRKAPFAQIGGIRAAPAPDDFVEEPDPGPSTVIEPLDPSTPRAGRPATRARRPSVNDEDIPAPATLPTSRNAGVPGWLPVVD